MDGGGGGRGGGGGTNTTLNVLSGTPLLRANLGMSVWIAGQG